MPKSPTADQSGIVAEEPEHRFASALHLEICYTLPSAEKQPGRTTMQEDANACQVSWGAHVNTKWRYKAKD